MRSPKVSVILPVYNQEKYIAQTIDSVLEQTYADFEIVILDDGSTDNTAQVIKEYVNKDERIKAYFHQNAGRGEATNKAANLATGELYALLDADDLMLPNRLEEQVAFHESNPDVHVSSCHCYYIDSDGKSLGVQRYLKPKSIEESIFVREHHKIVLCAITGIMIHKEAYQKVGGLRSEYWPCDDIEFVNRVIDEGFNLVILQKFLMKYRVHPNSVSAQKQKHMFDVKAFVINNINARRRGLPEASFDAYMKEQNKKPWPERVKIKLHNYSMMYLKNAGFSYYSRKYIKFGYEIAVAAIFDYKYVYATVRKKAGAATN